MNAAHVALHSMIHHALRPVAARGQGKLRCPRGEAHRVLSSTIAEHLAAACVTPDMFEHQLRLEDAWWQSVMISALDRFSDDAELAKALDAAAKHHEPLAVGMRVDVFDDEGELEAAAVICRIEGDAIFCDDEPDEPRPRNWLTRVQAGAAALLVRQPLVMNVQSKVS